MSLDLGSEGLAYNSVKVENTAVALGGITIGTFDSGDDANLASKLLLQLDNSGTPVANSATELPAPSALGVVGGTELVLINDTNGKKVTVIDPVTGITFDFVNRVGESITLVADGGGDQWVMAW